MARVIIRLKMEIVHNDNTEEEVYLDVPCRNDIIELVKIVDGLLAGANENDDQASISFITIFDENDTELV